MLFNSVSVCATSEHLVPNAKSLGGGLETHWIRSSRDTMILAKGTDDIRRNKMNYILDKRTLKTLQPAVTPLHWPKLMIMEVVPSTALSQHGFQRRSYLIC